MKQVISASRRTDIPAFYLDWFMQHLRKGFIDIPNPFNRAQVRQVTLTPKYVAWIVFWSRNYAHFLRHRQFFDGYRLFFHFTINPPNSLLEPGMIAPENAFNQLESLVALYGADSIVWRYDPVIFYRTGDRVRSNHTIHTFRKYLRRVSQLGITRCYTSVVNIYPKIIKRAARTTDTQFIEMGQTTIQKIVQEMIDTASLFGVRIYSCSNDRLLGIDGMKKGHCINGGLLNHLGSETVSEKFLPKRKACGCTASIDVGDYVKTACKYRCLYCYARP